MGWERRGCCLLNIAGRSTSSRPRGRVHCPGVYTCPAPAHPSRLCGVARVQLRAFPHLVSQGSPLENFTFKAPAPKVWGDLGPRTHQQTPWALWLNIARRGTFLHGIMLLHGAWWGRGEGTEGTQGMGTPQLGGSTAHWGLLPWPHGTCLSFPVRIPCLHHTQLTLSATAQRSFLRYTNLFLPPGAAAVHLVAGSAPQHQWCSGIMQDSHSCDPGSIPGWCT